MLNSCSWKDIKITGALSSTSFFFVILFVFYVFICTQMPSNYTCPHCIKHTATLSAVFLDLASNLWWFQFTFLIGMVFVSYIKLELTLRRQKCTPVYTTN